MKMVIKKNELFNIPNILTYIRILCVPAFVLVFFLVTKDNFINIYISLAIFAFASITDLVDGKIARKYNMSSDLGSVLDPLADKLLQVAVIICLTIDGYIHWIFPVLIGVKELYMIVGAAILANKNIVGKANFFGKAAAFILAIGIILSFFSGFDGIAITYAGTTFGKIYAIITNSILSLGTGFAFIAAVTYTQMVLKQIGGAKKLKDSENIKIDYSIKKNNDKQE